MDPWTFCQEKIGGIYKGNKITLTESAMGNGGCSGMHGEGILPSEKEMDDWLVGVGQVKLRKVSKKCVKGRSTATWFYRQIG